MSAAPGLLAGRRLLLTGGTGYIGRRLLRALAAEGAHVSVICREPAVSAAEWAAIEPRPLAVGMDLATTASFRRVELTHGSWDTLIHVAASIPGRPDSTGRGDHIGNLLMTSNLISALPDSVRHLIYTSTLDVYDNPHYLPMDEKHPLLPRSLYGVSKLACEHFLRVALAEKSISLATLRLSQVYGPGDPEIKVIPKFIAGLLEGRAPTINGRGEAMRDYVFADDVTRAVVLAAATEAAGTFNIATGEGVTIGEVARILCELAGGGAEPVFQNPDAPETRIRLDISAAREKLGYEPKTRIREGLEACWRAAVEARDKD